MADIYTGYRNYTRFYLSFWVAQQDIPNNRSLINWTAGIQASGANPQWYSNAVRINSVYINNQGNLANGTWSNQFLNNGETRPLRSGSLWVYHNSDGTKTINASISGWLFSFGDLTASGSLTLPTIPRNSQVSTNKSFYTLGEAITINTNRKSSSFTHTITIRKDNNSGTLIKTINSVGASTTWTPTSGEIATMEGLIPNSNNLTLYIRSYNNQVGQASSVTRVLTLTDANPTFEDFTFKDSNAAVTAVTGDDSVLVKGQSTLEVTIPESEKMVAVKSATESRYSTVYDGVTEQDSFVSSGDIVNTFTPNTIGQRTILVTAFDSRGNNTSVSKQVTVYDYSAPTIEATLTRENNFGDDTTIHLEGQWEPLVIGTAKNSLSTLQYRYKEDGGSFGSWTGRAFTATDDEWEMDDDFVVSLDNTKKYIFEFRISDEFETTTVEASVDIGQPIMFVGENLGSPAVGIGKMPEDGALDVDGDIYMNGDKVSVSDAKFKVGSFNGSNSTGSQVVSGVGFQPKLIKVRLAISDSTGSFFHMEGATDGSMTTVTGLVGAGGGFARWSNTSNIITVKNISADVIAQAALVSLDSDGFTINWTTATSLTFYYEAYG